MTAFDPTPGDGREPMHKVLAEGVKLLLNHVHTCHSDQLTLMLRLIAGRKDLIERELRLERMLSPDVLPPTVKNLYSLEFMFEESDVVRTYTDLLEALDEAEQTIRAKIDDQKLEAPASDI